MIRPIITLIAFIAALVGLFFLYGFILDTLKAMGANEAVASIFVVVLAFAIGPVLGAFTFWIYEKLK